MASKSDSQSTQTDAMPTDVIADLQKAGFGNMMGLGTAWMEAFSDLGAEVASFVAKRIQEDVKTQHQILHCTDMAELQHIQAEFVQKAIVQYQDETGKLVEMSTNAFAAGQKSKG